MSSMIKQRAITIFAIILITSILFLPVIKANSMITKDSKDDCCFSGTLSGGVGWETGGYSGTVIPFASIEIENVGKKHCNAIGRFRFTGLELNRTYKVIADANGYENDSSFVTLTEENPREEIYFILRENDEKDYVKKSKTKNDRSCCSGSIYGKVTETPELYYAPPPLSLLTIETDYKSTLTNFRGQYKLKNLPLNEEIVIKSCSDVHYNDEKTVILTEENPNQEVKFQLTQIPCDPTGYGRIYGKVITQNGDYYKSVAFADIEIEGLKRKKCTIQGEYEFKNLQLNMTYNITADEIGYKNLTKKVTISNENRVVQLYFLLEPDSDKRNKPKINNFKGLFQRIFELIFKLSSLFSDNYNSKN